MNRISFASRVLFLFVISVSFLLAVGTAPAQNITGCTVISSAGTYSLTADVLNSAATAVCIQINSSNVVLDGGGHFVGGRNTANTFGISAVAASPSRFTNITIRNVRLGSWYGGIRLTRVDNSTITNVTSSNNYYEGIVLVDSNGNAITNSSIGTNGTFGILLSGGSHDNVIADNPSITGQGQGIQLGYTSGGNATNNIIRGNSIRSNQSGILTAFATDTSGTRIENNTIRINYCGLRLNAGGVTISGNTIEDNYRPPPPSSNAVQYGGICLDSSGSTIYNNKFHNPLGLDVVVGGSAGQNVWNLAKQLGTNIIGGPYLGGNYWESEGCTDSDKDYICDNPIYLYPYDGHYYESVNIDYLPLHFFPDQDKDGVADDVDNCPTVANPDQANADGDKYGDACDKCRFVASDNDTDTNGNCPATPYLSDPQCGDVCEGGGFIDTDQDGIPDPTDDCPLVPNSNQLDSDKDGVGDACDNCPFTPNPDQRNSDGDRFGDACDNCLGVANNDQLDSDGDKYGNACDLCVSDPLKSSPGQCGCGVADTDSDHDGTADCNDQCPQDPLKTAPGVCGCGVADVDSDKDGILDCRDNCPSIRNADQADSDRDGVGDLCDNCPYVANRDQADNDGDGVGNVCDNCPNAPNGHYTVAGVCANGPDLGKPCTWNFDCGSPGVGTYSCTPMPRLGTCVETKSHMGMMCPPDSCGVGGFCSVNQEDTDRDRIGDACDADDDNDGVPDSIDNCRTISNRDQTDSDHDGIGNACNSAIDKDGDEWADSLDNCPNLYNPDQIDANNDGIGDACQIDLSISWIEVTQGIQDRQNSVPLMYGKDILVRVFLDVGVAKRPAGPVRGSLRFVDANGAPIMTYNAAGMVMWNPPRVFSDNIITAPVAPDRRNLNDTLNFRIPGDWRWDRATPYAEVSVLYSGTPPEIDPFSNNYRRVPLPLQAAGELGVMIVPLYSCATQYIDGYSPCPAVSTQEIQDTMRWLQSVYPISNINWWRMGRKFLAYDPTDSLPKGLALLDYLWWINLFTDDPLDNMKYYAIACAELDPTGKRILSGGSQTGMGNGDQAWGIRQDKHTHISLGGELMAEEIGHTILGGTPWGEHVRDSCDAGWPYMDYPVTNPYPGLIDNIDSPNPSFGFDGLKVYAPDRYFDVMTYSPCHTETIYTPAGTCSNDASRSCALDVDCYSPGSGGGECDSGKRLSKTNYERIYSWLISHHGGSAQTSQSLMAPQTSRFSMAAPMASGSAKPRLLAQANGGTEFLVASGNLNHDDQLLSYTLKRLFLAGGSYDVGVGDYSIELQGPMGEMLFARYFAPASPDQGSSGQFHEIVPFVPGSARILLKHGGSVLSESILSAHPPVITVVTPNGGESLRGTYRVTWDASDPDGDRLTYDVLYSTNGGQSWEGLAVNLTTNSYEWDTDKVPGSVNAVIRVLASDGINTSQDDSDTVFTVASKSPEVAILSPRDQTSLAAERLIIFDGEAYDAEDGSLHDSSLTWSSDKDGEIGTGRKVSSDSLSVGPHIITLAAVDSAGNRGTANISLTVSSADGDQDGVPDSQDNCPLAANPSQADADHDGVGDACDADDSDRDGYPDSIDNCPQIPNDQTDSDHDGIGDACQKVPGDLNGDRKVDCADIAIVKASFGKRKGQPGFDARADVNNDGVVDVRDLAFVSQKLPVGTKCS